MSDAPPELTSLRRANERVRDAALRFRSDRDEHNRLFRLFAERVHASIRALADGNANHADLSVETHDVEDHLTQRLVGTGLTVRASPMQDHVFEFVINTVKSRELQAETNLPDASPLARAIETLACDDDEPRIVLAGAPPVRLRAEEFLTQFVGCVDAYYGAAARD